MADVDKLISLLDDEEIVQVTREMVAIPSITHHEGMGMADYLTKWFKDLDIPVRLYPTGDGRANFFADYGATDGPGRYMFNGHQDIKPVDGMTVDPYAGEIRDGKMYGRGTCDMKGGIAGVLCAYKALVRAGVKPRGGISFFSDIEEEYSGVIGYHWAAKEGHFDGLEGLISCEPTELEVQIGNRGAYAVCFEAEGRSAHSGLAHTGINAVHNMVRFIREYLELPYLKVENPYFGRPTANFERISGGLYLSAVPDSCTASIDSRLIPETPPEVVQKQVDGLIERLEREDGIVIREAPQPSHWRPKTTKSQAQAIDGDHPFALRVRDAYSRALGVEPVVSGCPGVTIAMVLIERGIPAVICGPGSIRKAHTEDEYVPVDHLKRAARIYTSLMADM